ncbi:MAG: hypothetical protein AB7R69_06125, partial [Candidatus Babeliales bacterium]
YKEQLSSFTAADDLGIYILMPKLASFLHINVLQATQLFMYAAFFSAYLISIIGFFFYYKSAMQRIISFIGITALILFSLKIGDLYIFYVLPTIAFLPWSLYFYKKQSTSWHALIFYCIVGFLCAWGHYIRGYSSLGILIFVGILILTKKTTATSKLLSLLFLFLGLSIPALQMHYYRHQYTQFLTQNNIADPAAGIKNHLIWHAVYAGLGFLSFKNPDNIRWGDCYATQKAQEILPGVAYNTVEYEAVLKNEVIRLTKEHPSFMIMTLFAKVGILLLYLLIFANIGLIAAFFYPKAWPLELAFWSALAASSIFPLLVLPTTEYSLGFIAFAILYGVVSLNKEII